MTTGMPVAGILTAPIDINANGTADADEIADTMTKAYGTDRRGEISFASGRPLNLATKGKPTGCPGFHPMDPDRRSAIRG